MPNTPTTGADVPAPQPLTAASHLIAFILEGLGRHDDVNDFLSAALDQQATIIGRLSERLTALEDAKGIAPRITLPFTKIVGHNPRPGSLKKPKTKGQIFREKHLAADERRSKKIAERNSKPRKQGKK